MATRKTTAVAYLRVSGQGQISGDGFTRQRDTIAKFAKSRKLQLVDEFRDEGISGTTELDDRLGLAALLDRIDSNGVRIVIVENASRLARDLMVQEILLGEFRKRDVVVIEADGRNTLTVGSTDPTATLIRQVLGAVSQFEKSVLVLKLRAARQRAKRQSGKCEGRKAFGEKTGEAEIVAKIRELRRKAVKGDRASFAAIAAKLNADNVPTRSGAPWRPSVIGQILGRG
jgi:DNA invertase Pin-like site-specific DNA recombinase